MPLMSPDGMAPPSYKRGTESLARRSLLGQGGVDLGDSSFSARPLSPLSFSPVHATWFAHSRSTHFGLFISRQACQRAHAPGSPCRVSWTSEMELNEPRKPVAS